ncbi:hypothetical protein [Gordonia paraffinivorans]|uniref:hypothetical protein n=1 Tax=Gordonia paraffinivorans TaxID=175628 RepID=UPI0012FC0CDA|nr:hypothetical protein [Gordonia paraffinivorans]
MVAPLAVSVQIRELRDKRVELEQIKSAIAAEASTPEAQAARAAAAERLKVAGRQPGWSLQWNPTNYTVEEAGLNSREEYRVAAQRIEESRAAAYAAEKNQAEAQPHVPAATVRRPPRRPATHDPGTTCRSSRLAGNRTHLASGRSTTGTRCCNRPP